MATAYEDTVRPAFEPDSETYYVYDDPDSSWTVTTTLVLALGSLTGDEPSQMLPLNRTVDPDVLDSHVHGRTRGSQVSFDFHGYHVTVRDDGRIEFTPLDEQES